MLMAPLMFAKWWKFTTEKYFSYIINIYLNVKKKLDKFIVISNIELIFVQINLTLKFFVCLRLEL
jgi:hypothetical protein